MKNKTARIASDPQTMTQKEWLALAWLLFKTTDKMEWAFICPRCDKTWTIREFASTGVDPDRSYQQCIGRDAACKRKEANLPKGMCDWAAFGLFRGPWLITVEGDGEKPHETPAFAFVGATAKKVSKAKAETEKLHAEAKAFQDAREAVSPS